MKKKTPIHSEVYGTLFCALLSRGMNDAGGCLVEQRRLRPRRTVVDAGAEGVADIDQGGNLDPVGVVLERPGGIVGDRDGVAAAAHGQRDAAGLGAVDAVLVVGVVDDAPARLDGEGHGLVAAHVVVEAEQDEGEDDHPEPPGDAALAAGGRAAIMIVIVVAHRVSPPQIWQLQGSFSTATVDGYAYSILTE